MIPQGSYQAVAKEFIFGRAATGTEQVVVSFEIANGEHLGQRISWRGYFTEKTEERTLESLEVAGWDGVSLGKLAGLGSRPCVIVVEHEENNEGKTFAKVQWVNALGGGMSVKEKLETNEIQNLENRLKGLMLERAGKRGAVQSPRHQSQQPGRRGGGDDDLPF